MLQPSPRVTTADHRDRDSRSEPVQQQLRALDKEHRETLTALNHAQASVTRAMLLVQREYLQRRQHILNGHDEEALR